MNKWALCTGEDRSARADICSSDTVYTNKLHTNDLGLNPGWWLIIWGRQNTRIRRAYCSVCHMRDLRCWWWWLWTVCLLGCDARHVTVFGRNVMRGWRVIMAMPLISITLFTAEYFLAHWLVITCRNEQTQNYLWKDDNVCIPTVYHWLYLSH